MMPPLRPEIPKQGAKWIWGHCKDQWECDVWNRWKDDYEKQLKEHNKIQEQCTIDIKEHILGLQESEEESQASTTIL